MVGNYNSVAYHNFQLFNYLLHCAVRFAYITLLCFFLRNFPAYVAQWGERWTLEPAGMWQPGPSRFGVRYLLLTG